MMFTQTSCIAQSLKKAKELKLQVEAVPIERFIPLPDGNEQRNIYIGQFANLDDPCY